MMSKTKTDQKKEKGQSTKDKMIKIKESEYQKLADEVKDYKDKYVRLCAEFDNARKRTERERIEFIKYANEDLIKEFLDIFDNLERSVEAAKASHQDYNAFLKGTEMVMAQIYELLKKNDVKQIETKGKPFDPHRHEVLMQEETDEYDEGIVVEEYQRGYQIGDRVVRTAKVKVTKKKQS